MVDSPFVDGVCNARKRKICDIDEISSQNVLKGFKLSRVLRDDPKRKIISVVGHFERGEDVENDQAVLILEKLPFDKTTIGQSISLEDRKTVENLKNDIYSVHMMYAVQSQPDCKVTLIYPAVEKHIEKYSQHEVFVVRETPDMYRAIAEPCMQASKFSLQWVYNILNKQTEADRIVFEDPDPAVGFILLPDMKWNGTSVESLHLIAIVHKCGLRSLRDLTSNHLALLSNILHNGKTAVHKRFDIPPWKLRIYLHYRPSYHHLHIHFTHIDFEAPGCECTQAHLLEDVIENISNDGQFYSKKSLTYTVKDGDDIHKALVSSGYLTA